MGQTVITSMEEGKASVEQWLVGGGKEQMRESLEAQEDL